MRPFANSVENRKRIGGEKNASRYFIGSFEQQVFSLFTYGLLIEFVPAEVNVSVTEVTDELVSGSGNILHDGDFKETNEADDLSNSVERNGIRSLDGGNTVRVGVEGVTRVVNVSWKVDSGTGDDVSEETKHGNTAVLDLDVSETIESFLIGSYYLSKRDE